MNSKLFKVGLISLISLIVLSFGFMQIVSLKEVYIFEPEINLQIIEPDVSDDLPIIYFDLKTIDNSNSKRTINFIKLIDNEDNEYYAEKSDSPLSIVYVGLYKSMSDYFYLNLTNFKFDQIDIKEVILHFNDNKTQSIKPKSFTVSKRLFFDNLTFKNSSSLIDEDFQTYKESWTTSENLKFIGIDSFDSKDYGKVQINGLDYEQLLNQSIDKNTNINIKIETPIKRYKKLAYMNYDSYLTLMFENEDKEISHIYLNLERSVYSHEMKFKELFRQIKLGAVK